MWTIATSYLEAFEAEGDPPGGVERPCGVKNFCMGEELERSSETRMNRKSESATVTQCIKKTSRISPVENSTKSPQKDVIGTAT